MSLSEKRPGPIAGIVQIAIFNHITPLVFEFIQPLHISIIFDTMDTCNTSCDVMTSFNAATALVSVKNNACSPVKIHYLDCRLVV